MVMKKLTFRGMSLKKYARRRAAMRNRRRGYRLYRRPRPTKRTGFLPIVQKDLDQSFVIPAGAYPNGYIKQFKFDISGIQNLPELTRLFDQYRIRAVSIRMVPQTNTSETVNPAMTFASSIDLDGGALGTFDELLACSNCKVSNWSNAGGSIANKNFYMQPRYRSVHVIDPTTVPPTYGQSLGPKNAWLDLADGGQTDHFGLNVGWLPGGPGYNLGLEQWINVTITYYIQFRKIR